MAPSNKHWLFLEELRRSGKVNMFAAVPYLQEKFDLKRSEAIEILADWMKNYDPTDYEGGTSDD